MTPTRTGSRFARACHRGGFALIVATAAQADDANKTLKIGVVYDLTGPFAGGGSELHYLGAKTMIDWFIAHGGVEGYKIEAVYADAQSKPDVAINEAVRLIEQEKVDMLLGLLLLGRVRAGRGAHRGVQEVHVDHHLHRLAGAARSPPEIRVPPAALRHAVGPGLHGDARGLFEGATRQGPEGPARRHHPRGRRPMAPTSPRAMPKVRQRPACRSCSTKAIRSPRPTCRRWSPN